MKKLKLSLLLTFLVTGCSTAIQPIDNVNSISHSSVILSNSNKLNKEAIARLDKEYLSFNTKALSAEYFQKKIVKLIASDNGITNGSKIVQELQYAKYKGENVIPFKAMITANPSFYSTLTGIDTVIAQRTIDSPFDIFISNNNPVTSTNIIYVNSSATGLNNGTSWTNAHTSLQDALTNSTSGKDIWVAKGTYKPSSDKAISFQMKSGVNIYGGFIGTETQQTQRNFTSNITILSGDLDNSNTYNDGDTYIIVKGANNSIIDGFTVQHSYNNSSSTNGGGMYNNNVSPTINNIIFSNNYASHGGGMYNYYQSSPALTNVTFSNNYSSGNGGGLYNLNTSSPVLTNVTFSNNYSSGNGGGMCNGGSSPTLTNVTFSSNSANSGGGLYNILSSPILTNVTLSDNSANSGGGMYNNNKSSPILTNVTFSSNSATNNLSGGGGMYNINSSSPTITNATFYNNSAATGVGIYSTVSSPTIKNSIFWGSSNNMIFQNYGTLKIGYSNLQTGYTNITLGSSAVAQSLDSTSLDTNNFTSVGHNIFADPLFVVGSLTLQAGSPSINTGTSVEAPAKDIIGTDRPQGSGYDMGAYEFIQ